MHAEEPSGANPVSDLQRRCWSVLENAGDLVTVLSGDGCIRYASPSSWRLLGYLPDEMVGRTAWELVHPADLETVQHLFSLKLTGSPEAPPVSPPFRCRAADGSWLWLESIAANLLGDPVVGGLVVHSRDVTPWKLAEDRLRYVMAHANCLLWLAEIEDKGTGKLGWRFEIPDTDAAQRFLPLDVPAGSHYFRAWYDARLEEDRERTDRYGEAEVRAGQSYHQEFRCRDRDGEIHWLHEEVHLERIGPGRWRAVGVCNDITEQKRTEQRDHAFQALGQRLNSATTPREAALIVLEVADQLLGWDACWLELIDSRNNTGSSELAMDLVEGVRTDVTDLQRFAGINPLTTRALEDGGVIVLRTPETMPRLDRGEGMAFGDRSRPSASILCAPIRNGSRGLGAVSIQSYSFQAYTEADLRTLQALADYCAGALERTQAEAERRQLQEQLIQAQKLEAVGRLAGGVAHDFNNMLAVINGYTELLLHRKDLPAEVLTPLREVRNAGNRAAELTRQLLGFGQRQMIQPRVLELEPLLRNLQPLLARMLGEDVQLSLRSQGRVGHVKADPGQIEQIVMNLAANSRDAMPHGGTLTIRLTGVAITAEEAARMEEVAPGRYVRLTVTDTGCGMDAATLAHVFEPFFTTKGVGAGPGLGLATVYGIVKQNGGHVEVESTPGKGTTFTLYLPELGAGDAAAPSTSPTSGGGTETILVAEDEELLRKLVVTALTQRGYQVLSAANAAQALELLESHPGTVDLLLTDVVMPGGSGRGLAGDARRRCPALKVIYVSGHTDDAILRHGISAAEVTFLQKPFTPSELVRKVRAVLDCD